MEKSCLNCGRIFSKSYYTSKKVFAKQKFCGQECFGESKRGITKPMSIETKIKIAISNKNNKSGLINGTKTRFKGSEIKAWDLIGGKNEYRNLHKWIQKQLGKPDKCSKCGKIAYGRQIHWANKSKTYKKDVNDWIRLCVKCHYEFDENRKVLPVKK